MCRLCFRPPAIKPTTGTCSRCGHDGTTWTIHRRLVPPEVPWPRWDIELICYRCVAYALTAA